MKTPSRVLLSLMLASCAADDLPGEELEVTCDGKCDGIGSLRSLIRDAKELDLGDLVAVGSKLGANALSDNLAGADFASIKIGEPKFFALPGVSVPDLTLENVDELVSGLAARYGERELSTQVNQIRRDHLMTSQDQVFVESAFRINANADWGHSVGGFGSTDVRVGFGAGGSIEARVIGAYQSELAGVARGPLKALKELRGFVMPRGIADIRSMKPGESFALTGEGHLGANLGAGVPILIANPGAAITYNLVLSAGIRARIAGQLDVQLVRLEGDEVVVDIGMQKVREWSARLAIEDSWGVQGLLESNVSLGGVNVDLGRLVDKALQKQLNDKLNLFKAEVSSGTTASRVSVARLRFNLDATGAEVAPALAQALEGDVRLAQALANRGEPGVVAEFDLLRSGSSSTSFAGVDILGMSFFKRTIQSEGSVVIQTPGGARSLLFQSLRKSSGSWFSEHGYTRVGLSGLNFDPNNAGEARGEANLFVQLQEADEFMERDKMLDHVDAAILALGGTSALSQVEQHGNALERFVEASCPSSQAFDPCRTNVLSNSRVVDLRRQGVEAVRTAANRLSPSQAAELTKLAEFRMTTQATYEPKAQLVGPDATFTIDYRLDDAALTYLMTQRDAVSFKSSLEAYASAVEVDRIDPANDISLDRATALRNLQPKTRELSDIFAAAQADYKKLLNVEKAVITSLGPIGPRALEIRVPVDAQRRVQYEQASVGSLAEARSRVATRLFDNLVSKSGGLSTHVEQIAGYVLLGMLEPARMDLRFGAQMNLSDGFSQDFEHYRAAGYAPFDLYGKGDKVAPIDGGLFSIDALISGN